MLRGGAAVAGPEGVLSLFSKHEETRLQEEYVRSVQQAVAALRAERAAHEALPLLNVRELFEQANNSV